MVKKAKVAMWIKATGPVDHVVPSKGGKFTLEEVQKMVGGLVERVRLQGGMVLLVNEEGIPRELPLNRYATQMVGFIVLGDAVILPIGMGW